MERPIASRRWVHPRALPTLALLIAVACGSGEGPTGSSSPACRQWWQDVVSDTGRRWTCTAGGTSPRCSAFPVSQYTTWTYASVEDFVREAAIPNRLFVLRKEGVGCGTFAYIPCSLTVTEYTYDAQARLVRRERLSGTESDDLALFDTTTYTAWDTQGRPTAGQIEANGRRETIGISYDDASRLMEATNGELVQQDRHGNTVREAVRWGVGDTEPWTTSYTIESLQAVCAP